MPEKSKRKSIKINVNIFCMITKRVNRIFVLGDKEAHLFQLHDPTLCLSNSQQTRFVFTSQLIRTRRFGGSNVFFKLTHKVISFFAFFGLVSI